MPLQNIIELARELVATLVHLKEAPQGVPGHGLDGHAAIRKEYASNHLSERGADPLLSAAENWVQQKLSEALRAHEIPSPAQQAAEPSDAPQPTGGETEQGIPLVETPPPAERPIFATVENGGVALHEKPLGELTDAELEALTAPQEDQS